MSARPNPALEAALWYAVAGLAGWLAHGWAPAQPDAAALGLAASLACQAAFVLASLALQRLLGGPGPVRRGLLVGLALLSAPVVFAAGPHAAAIPWGAWLVALGALARRAGLATRGLVALLWLGGLAQAVDGLLSLRVPDTAILVAPLLGLAIGAGQLTVLAWLLWLGLRARRDPAT
ncbi:MAG: hypothetical protein QM704_04920 [Anaeromyxobacteraceae bacterium]